MKPSRVVYPALDGLRGIAVLLVMVHNLTILDDHDTLAQKLWVALTDSGWIGVQLFFVLSGFLITGILLDDRGAPHYFKNFYIRRFVRIFPLYYLLLAIRFLVVPLFDADSHVSLDVALWFILYVSNWSPQIDEGVRGCAHFWSLAVEEQFYLAWPLAVAKLSRRGIAIVAVALIAASAIARIVILLGGYDQHMLYMSTVTRADAIAMGALVALAIRSDVWRPRLARYALHAGAAATLVLAAVMVRAHGLSRFDTGVECVGYTMLAVIFAVIVADIALDPGRTHPRWVIGPSLRGLTMTAPLRTAGRYSYAAYVFHTPLKILMMRYCNGWFDAHGVHHSAAADAAVVGAVMVASFALAAVSWVVLEKPLSRLKDRWAPREAEADGK